MTLSPAFEKLVRDSLPPDRNLAADVLKLSDFYHAHAGEPTPWQDDFTPPAYVSYFLPLNYARLRAVWREVERFQPTVGEVWDFGSGIGTTQWVLEDSPLTPAPLYCLERSPEAIALHQQLQERRQGRWQAQFKNHPRKPGAHALGVFSYSFLEMQRQLPRLEDFENLLIVEPSTRECGRQLMEWRARLLKSGFHVLAPCTHAEPCPLLTHSQRDWCHMRTPFEAPDWWLELEAELPMKNRTLTYSYLLVSRTLTNAAVAGRARVTGDTLEERGKSKQMICRGPAREFVSWLHRNGPPPRIPHGALIDNLQDLETKGNELRVSADKPLSWED